MLQNALCLCYINQIIVNPVKKTLITYSRRVNVIVNDYTLEGTMIEGSGCMSDIGVVLDASF